MAENFEKHPLFKRVKTMLKVDFRRMFTTPLFYIMLGICLVVPVAVVLMTEMNAGGVTINPETGEETVVEGFKSVWQVISSVSGSNSMSMDITSMCNMNLVYFAVGVFMCLFVGSEFRSGYAKNLFTYRSKKSEYVISKTIAGALAGIFMIIAFFVGSMVGGGIAGLSFEMQGFNGANIVACLLAKLFLVGLFAAISLLACVFAKQKIWLSICISIAATALLFMMIPLMSPLNSGALQPVLCFAGSAIFAFALGAASNLVLNKTDIV